jgi:hypothetical protein
MRADDPERIAGRVRGTRRVDDGGHVARIIEAGAGHATFYQRSQASTFSPHLRVNSWKPWVRL